MAEIELIVMTFYIITEMHQRIVCVYSRIVGNFLLLLLSYSHWQTKINECASPISLHWINYIAILHWFYIQKYYAQFEIGFSALFV